MKYAMSICFAFLLVCASQVCAAEKTFVMMPFTVNAPQSYNYLGKSVPGTIQSNISRPGILKGINASAKSGGESAAKSALKSTGADYAIWGVVNVVGNDCSLEVHSIDKTGKIWSKSASAPLSQLTGSVQGLSASLASEAMGAAVAAKPAFMTPGARQGMAVPTQKGDIIVNETGQNNQVYLNPQFRYQGAGASDGSRLRTQRLKGNMVDMAVGDFNGDGLTEIAIIGDHNLTIYIWEQNGKLKELGTTTVSQSNQNFSMRAIDLDRDGAKDLVIATFEEDSNRPYSYFFSFKGNKFSAASPRIPYFASVMRLPPSFNPVLVGQGYDSIKLFATGVHQLVKQDGKYALGPRISLPGGANVFNVAWIPAGKGQDGDLLVMLTDNEKIKVYQGKGNNLVHTTMENFSGSATGMEFYKTMPGLSPDKTTQLPGKYYAPMRLIAADIGNTGENVLLLNKPISTASNFFDRYRFFPQGEVHALFWDGVGLGLKWKTRRIRGSVAEIDLGDVTNDGILDLVVGLNTSPELGIGNRQSMVTAYPLDVTQTDPNTPADMSDFEIAPSR